MRKKLLALLAGGALAVASVAALALTGTPPGTGPQLQDGSWLNGLAGGLNWSYQYGITAAGTTQATATQIPAGYYLVEADTVPASSGLALPPCYQGTELHFYDNTATNVIVYPAVANNPATSAQDTILNTTSLTVSAHTAEIFFCAKNGVWAAK